MVNFGTQAATVKILYSRTNGTGTALSTVATLIMPPQSSKGISISALDGDSKMRNSFIFQSDAPAGSFAASLVAVGGMGSENVQLIGKDQKQVPNGGAHPWTISDGMTSTLLLFNHSNSEQSFDVNISAGGTFWQQQYKLGALETKSLSVNDLIATSGKDQKGKVLPNDSKEGEIGWSVEGASNGTVGCWSRGRISRWRAASVAAHRTSHVT